jgi:hypothetical protein
MPLDTWPSGVALTSVVVPAVRSRTKRFMPDPPKYPWPGPGVLSCKSLVRSVAELTKASLVPSGLKTSWELPAYPPWLPCESFPPGVTLTAVVFPAARL